MNDEWVETTLGSITEITKGRKPQFVNDSGIGEIYLLADYLRTSQITKWVADEPGVISATQDDTLILWDGAGAGDVFPGAEGVVASTMARIRSMDERLHPRFLQLQIAAKAGEIKSSNRGTTVPHVSPEALRAIRILVPPLAVQRRIVDLLAHLDNHLANLQTEREALTDTRNATVRSHFTAAASGYQSVGSLLSIRTGKLDVNQGSENGPFPFFTCSREVHRIDWADFHGEAVIIAGNGDLNVRYFDGDFNAYQRTYVLQPLDSFNGNLKYIYLFFEHHVSTLRINSSGSVIKYIKLGDLRDAQIPDRSRTEQEALVDSVFATDRLIDETDSELMAICSLRSHLLSALLSGSYSISDQYDDLLSEVA